SITGDDLVDIPKQIAAREVFLLGTIDAEYEVIGDADSNGDDSTEGDVCGDGSDVQPTDDGGGEGVGNTESEESSEEEE
ncbi:hypothetical protein LCGC14_2847810, partial [marine sediment metagenome]